MDKDTYFVIREGGTEIEQVDERGLLTRLNGDYYGNGTKFFLEKCGDPDYWPDDAMLIIKGRIIVPKPVTEVTAYRLPS